MAEEAAPDATAEEGGPVETESGGGPKNKKMAKGNKPGNTKGGKKTNKKVGSIVYMYPRKPPIGPSFSPCPHIYFKHPVVRRSILNQKGYDELLATPKGEPWKEPEEELQMFRRRLLTPRTECLAMPPKRKLIAHLDDFSGILTPQMVDNIEILLSTKCELPAEDTEKEKAKKRAAAAKKRKKEKLAKKKAAMKKGAGAAKTGKGGGAAKKGKGAGAAKQGKGAKAAAPPTEGAVTGDEEEEEGEEGEEGGEGEGAAAEGGEGEGAAAEGAEAEGAEGGEGEGAAAGEAEGAEGEVEGEEGEGAEGEEEEELTESQLKLRETTRPIKEYIKWLDESLSKANNWAGWITDTVAQAENKAAKKKGTVLAKDGTPKKLTCEEWNAWKKQLTDNVENWQSAKKDILESANNWDKFLKIRSDKIKAGESFTVPNPQAWQESFGKFSSTRVSKA